MIFLSHNTKDKIVVEQFAIRLRDIFGQDAVFYDSWSIQPGDGIIDKMSEGLSKCKLFLFFVSKNSLQSNMVKLEWQNAVIKSTKGETKIIPVKMDDCLMPPILFQSLYIDLFGQGIEIALRQIIDVISGRNTFQGISHEFSNLRAYLYEENGKYIVQCRAEYFMEPKSHFLFIVTNNEHELTFSCKTSQLCTIGFNQNIKLNDGKNYNGQLITVDSPTVPGFPFIVEIQKTKDIDMNLVVVMHEKKQNEWRGMPLINQKPID